MPRPRKCRRVCCVPENTNFGPLENCAKRREAVVMTVDEFETIRLIDYEGLTQEECAERMCISRTTTQAIYSNARLKLAKCLVTPMKLVIEGGDIVLCKGESPGCGAKRCPACAADK